MKTSQNSRILGFSYYFCLMMEGSGFGTRSGSVQIITDPDSDPGGPKTHGSGSTTLLLTYAFPMHTRDM
jgi:hypothetical protein